MNQGCPKKNAGNTQEAKPLENLLDKLNGAMKVKKVIGIVSGKGGVGKSLVTSLLASKIQKKGFQTAILDGDITGPSIPKAFGLNEKAKNDKKTIFPVLSKNGTKIISINLLTENETDPVIWRGPVISGIVKQFWTDVNWGEVDYMFIDMPPGTGDVPLTVYQSIPIDGVVIVSTPQELVGMIVEKAVNMAKMMNVPVLGLVENMSYVECPDCDKKINIFGDSRLEEIAIKHNIKLTAGLPINKKISSACDAGKIEDLDFDYLDDMVISILEKTS